MTKIQKTFLSLLATSTAFCASAESLKENSFYLSGSLGSVLQNKIATENDDTDDDKFKSSKSKTAFEFGVGAGYYVTNKFRVEALFVKPFLNKTKWSDKQVDLGQTEFYEYAYLKPKVVSLQIRGYHDLINLSDIGRLYAGAGIGVSNVKAKRFDIDTQETVEDLGGGAAKRDGGPEGSFGGAARSIRGYDSDGWSDQSESPKSQPKDKKSFFDDLKDHLGKRFGAGNPKSDEKDKGGAAREPKEPSENYIVN